MQRCLTRFVFLMKGYRIGHTRIAQAVARCERHTWIRLMMAFALFLRGWRRVV